MKTLIGYDTETFLIRQECLFPRIVCLSLAQDDERALFVNADWELLQQNVAALLTPGDHLAVAHNGGFDLGVFATNFPHLLPAIFQALDAGQFSDTLIREKLLALTETGDLEFELGPGHTKVKLKVSLADLVLKYIGIDISKSKGESDAWRLHYDVLDNVPHAEWPPDAATYAEDDASYTLQVWQHQEARRMNLIATRGLDPFLTESFRVYVDFCLKLMSAHGAWTDPERVAQIEAMLVEELAPEKTALLVSEGILRPATPPRPHKGRKPSPCLNAPCTEACPLCRGTGLIVPMTAGTEESIDTKKLKTYVTNLANALNTDPASPVVTMRMTEPSKTFPEGQLSVDADFLKAHAHLDPLLAQMQHRQKLQKLVTTEIPRMKLHGKVAQVVHPQYDPLKETGRTSSYSSKSSDYASANIQNIDPRVKPCYVPRPGHLLFSADYSQMELGTLAQKCFNLFGFSVLKDKINAGVDVHGYTGAQLAFAMDTDFATAAAVSGATTPDDIAELFFSYKDSTDEKERKFFRHWRKFAKPVNLGFPGGLGADTFVTYAASEQYGVIITRDQAKLFRDLWKQTYPEMVEYFAYINKKCIDPHNKGWDDKNKQEYDLYAYESPYGMYRAGCDYCACANGLGLQTPSADGVLTATIKVMTACYDPSSHGILAPTPTGRVLNPWGIIHDELVGEVLDDAYVHERMMEVKRLMIESMAVVTPDVTPNANVCLMRRWDKAAEPVFDAAGRLSVWLPKSPK